MDNPFQSPTILSYCTGIRGIERGLERAIGKLNVLANVEIDAFIVENLLQGMEQGKMDPTLIFTDIKTFPAKYFSGKVDGMLAGWPCQPFSNAGQRKGTEDPRHLWPYIAEHIATIKPVFVFGENVAGHLTLGFPEVLESLRNIGYRVEVGIFTAEEVGAPHKRERLFILAIRNDVELANSKSGRWDSSALSKHDGEEIYARGGCRLDNSGTNESAGNSSTMANPTGIHEAGNPNPWQSLELDETSGWMEQGRHELGNTPNDGHIAATQQGSSGKDSERPKEREVEAIEPAGTVGSGGGPGIQGGEELANAGIDTLEGREIERGIRGKSWRTGEELANGNGIGCLYIEPEIDPTKAGIDAQRDLAAGNRDELGNAESQPPGRLFIGTEKEQPIAGIAIENIMANANGSGSGEDSEPGELRSSGAIQPPGNSWGANKEENDQGRFDRWPSGPGQPQHEWEQPRTIGGPEDGGGDEEQNGELGYTSIPGLQRGELNGTFNEGIGQFEPYGTTIQPSETRWPSGPGQPQHEWEQPRTIGYTNRLPRSIRKLWHSVRPDLEKIMGQQIWEITNHNIEASIEPALGSSVDGYEYREYFLRALGNSVVEQTAELAFLTLLQKHIDNHAKQK